MSSNELFFMLFKGKEAVVFSTNPKSKRELNEWPQCLLNKYARVTKYNMQDSSEISLSVVSGTYTCKFTLTHLPDEIKPKGRITRQYNPKKFIQTS